jgi:uncharacterized protein (DUF1778 family)
MTVENSRRSKGERLEARISAETKALFQKAARLQGRSLTDFVVNSAVDAARRAVRESEFMDLSQRDRAAFVDAVLRAPAPKNRLRKAAARHQLVFGRR